MATKNMSYAERKALIEFHASRILQNFRGIGCPTKSDVTESIDRLHELTKGVPKHEWAVEQ